jgi:formylglycine-generating enzyme
VFRLTNPLLAVAFVGCGRLNFDATPGINSTDSASDTGASLAVTSCLQIAPTCGGAKDCCENNVVPGGTFLRSYDLAGDGMYPNSMYSATVQAFRFDTFEVTVGRFRAFVRAGKGTQSAPPSIGDGANPYVSNSGWTQAMTSRLPATTPLLIAKLKCGANAMWTDAAGANENRAVNCVSWHESMAFCAWDGGFVPTEAEWNFAAAGGDEQRAYPWSSPPASLAIDTTMASYNAEMTFFDVGSKPAGNARWGQADLAGGLWEWTRDRRIVPYPSTSCTDCATLTGGTDWAVRGGSLYDNQPNLRTGTRSRNNQIDPGERQQDIGLRCARPI